LGFRESYMKFLVTGSAGHLGEALIRTLREMNHEVVGLDILESPYTTEVGSISERSTAMRCMSGVEVVLHAATLHKPHVGTHSRQEFVDTNVTGTLNLLEAAVSEGVKSFVYTSTTSVFGDALVPGAGAPAAWITEEVTPVPKNIYGVTKTLLRICANCSIEIRDFHVLCCEHPGSFLKKMTTRKCGRSFQTRM
jgi:UDP-glucose 4-epimerase